MITLRFLLQTGRFARVGIWGRRRHGFGLASIFPFPLTRYSFAQQTLRTLFQMRSSHLASSRGMTSITSQNMASAFKVKGTHRFNGAGRAGDQHLSARPVSRCRPSKAMSSTEYAGSALKGKGTFTNPQTRSGFSARHLPSRNPNNVSVHLGIRGCMGRWHCGVGASQQSRACDSTIRCHADCDPARLWQLHAGLHRALWRCRDFYQGCGVKWSEVVGWWWRVGDKVKEWCTPRGRTTATDGCLQ
jgi:hypothetical protein